MAQQEDVSSPGILLVDALRSKYCPAEEEDAVHKETTVRDCGEVREFAIASRPGNAYRTSPRVPLWPSGLRRWFKAPAIAMVWVRVPPLQFFFLLPLFLSVTDVLYLQAGSLLASYLQWCWSGLESHTVDLERS